MINETSTCPICGRILLEVGMRNHIIGSAKGELYRWYFDRSFPRTHLDHVEKNTVIEKVKVVKLRLLP